MNLEPKIKKGENILIPYIEHHLTDHCNLNCNGCSHFSPLAEHWFESFEEFSKDFEQLSNITNGEVRWIRLAGGEPLLLPDIEKYFIECRRLFPCARIELVTNGTLLNKKDDYFVEVCNKYQIFICISNYGIIDVQKALERFKYIRYYDKITTMYNICLDPEGNQNILEAFTHCEMHANQWNYFQRGRMYPCCVLGNIDIFNKYFDKNIFTSEDDMSISVYNHTEQEIIDFLNYPRQACKFCNTSKRHDTYHNFAISKRSIEEWIAPN